MDYDQDCEGLPFSELCPKHFYPMQMDIRQTCEIACKLAKEAASVFLAEFRDTSKAPADHLLSIDVTKSCANI